MFCTVVARDDSSNIMTAKDKVAPDDTPLSQATTAPSTPALNFTLSDGSPDFDRQLTFERMTTAATNLESTPEDTEDEEEDCEIEHCASAGQKIPLCEWPPVMPEADVEEGPRMCTGVPVLQSDLGKWAQWAVRYESTHSCASTMDEDDDSISPMAAADMELTDGDSDAVAWEAVWPPKMAEADIDELPRLCTGVPKLQSELGKWAQWVVQWEEMHGVLSDPAAFKPFEYGGLAAIEEEELAKVEWPPLLPSAAKEEVPRMCVGMPALQSELGKWAQWAVRWEEEHGVDEDAESSDCESDTTSNQLEEA